MCIQKPGGYVLNSFNQRKKCRICFLLFLLLAGIAAGCGKKDAELENYKLNMNQFFENVRIFDESINAIDPHSETAVSDLLSLLDSMETSFSQMASLEVPEGFPGVDVLADEASHYMSEAVTYFHQAYEGKALTRLSKTPPARIMSVQMSVSNISCRFCMGIFPKRFILMMNPAAKPEKTKESDV